MLATVSAGTLDVWRRVRRWRLAVGWIVSLLAIVLLVATFSQIEWGDVQRAFAAVQLGWLVPALVCALVVELAKTARWRLLLGASAPRYAECLAVVLASRVLNSLTPFRAGDVWRVATASNSKARSVLHAGGALGIEKAFDALGLGVLVAGLLTFGRGSGSWSPAASIGAVGLISLIGLGSMVLLVRSGWVGLVGDERRAKLQPLRDELSMLGIGLSWRATVLTALGIGAGLAVNLAALTALGLPGGLGAATAMLLAGYAAGLVPAGPGQIGVYEVAVAAPLMAGGLARPDALAAAIAVHAVLVVTLLVGGVIALGLGARRPVAVGDSPAAIMPGVRPETVRAVEILS